ncbi:MAG: hypothetical protein U0271_44630 [Polyangiaceae bacterium]
MQRFKRGSALLVSAAAVAAAVASSAPALADEPGKKAPSAEDVATADALFTAAKDLQAKGDLEAACPKFQASFELSPELGVLLNWANCLEKLGKLASAAQRWQEGLALATDKNDSRKDFADKQLQALLPRVPKLVVDVSQGSETLAIRLNGADLPETKWGLPVSVDPGDVKLEILRGEAVLETRPAVAKESETTHVQVDLDAIAKAHPLAKPKAEPPNPAQRYAGFAVMSLGLAGMATFAVLEAVALGQRSAADGEGGCIDRDGVTYCSPQGYDLVTRAGDFAEIGQWIGVASVAVFAVGLTVILTAPSEEPEKKDAPKKLGERAAQGRTESPKKPQLGLRFWAGGPVETGMLRGAPTGGLRIEGTF